MGAQVLDKAGVEQLAKLPSLDELRGKLVGLLQAPAQKVVGVVSGGVSISGSPSWLSAFTTATRCGLCG